MELKISLGEKNKERVMRYITRNYPILHQIQQKEGSALFSLFPDYMKVHFGV